MNYRIVKKEAFKVLEKVEQHSVETVEHEKTIPEFWDRERADGTVDTLTGYFAAGEKYLCGICYAPSSADSKTFEYSIAARCGENCIAPEGYRINEIPARTWAVFDCVGPMPKAIQELWHKIVSEFFPTSDYEPTYEMDCEVYSDGDITADDYKSQIWVAVKKK